VERGIKYYLLLQLEVAICESTTADNIQIKRNKKKKGFER